MNRFLFWLLLVFPLCAQATDFDLTLQWDENKEPDLATGTRPRYRIYYKLDTSGQGLKLNYIGQPGEPAMADEGLSPVAVTVARDESPDPAIVQFTMHNLDDTRIYYFAVTALDESGNESDLSNEVSIGPKPKKPKIFLEKE